jgi:branched-chain amino acid transport system substrate-binding protein
MKLICSRQKFASRFIAQIAVLGLLANLSVAHAQTDVVRIGQIVPLTGGLANVGKEINAVTQATIAQYNSTGKFKIELITEDDGNQPDRSAAAVAALSTRTIGLLSCFGTVSCVAQMKASQEVKLPLIGPIAGAALLRDKQVNHVFAIRASASDELNRLIKFAQAVNFKELNIAVQDDGFGQGYLAALKPLIVNSGIEIKEIAILNSQNPDYEAAVKNIQKSPSSALLLLVNATHSVGILKSLKSKNSSPFILNLPGQANALYASGVKDYKGGTSFATVTPSPWDSKLQIQRDYQATMAEAKITNYSYLGFEAYINARIAIDAITQSRSRTASSLTSTLKTGNFSVSGWIWRHGDPYATRFTDLALLRSDGTYKH